MADSVTLLILVLATYRLATDLAWESGPGRLYERLRGGVMQRVGPDSSISEGVSCPICLSFWLAPVIYLAWLYVPIVVVLLAAAGGAALLARQKGGE